MKKDIAGVIHTEGIVLPGDLESLELQVYEEFAPRAIIRKIFAIKDNDPPYATAISYDKIVTLGKTGDNALNTLGPSGIKRIDAAIVRYTQAVRDFAYSITLPVQDVKAARALGRNLESVKTSMVARQMALDEQELFLKGDSALGIQGLLTVFDTASGTTGNWSSATDGLTIYEDIRKAIATLRQKDDMAQVPLILLAHPVHRENLSKFLEADNPIKMVKEAIEANEWFSEMYFSESMPTTKVIICSNDPAHVRLSVVQDIARGEPVYDLLGNAEVAFTYRTAGAVVYYDEAGIIINGV